MFSMVVTSVKISIRNDKCIFAFSFVCLLKYHMNYL